MREPHAASGNCIEGTTTILPPAKKATHDYGYWTQYRAPRRFSLVRFSVRAAHRAGIPDLHYRHELRGTHRAAATEPPGHQCSYQKPAFCLGVLAGVHCPGCLGFSGWRVASCPFGTHEECSWSRYCDSRTTLRRCAANPCLTTRAAP